MTRMDSAIAKLRTRKAKLQCIGIVVAVVALAVFVRISSGPGPIQAAPPAKAAPQTKPADGPIEKPAGEKLQIVAVVNGEKVTRIDLAQEALVHYGDEVLEMLVNKHLILEGCKARGIGVTHQEVADEMDQMAQRFGVPLEQWLKMLREERNITPQQYASDII